jgi:hypothetical protein
MDVKADDQVEKLRRSNRSSVNGLKVTVFFKTKIWRSPGRLRTVSGALKRKYKEKVQKRRWTKKDSHRDLEFARETTQRFRRSQKKVQKCRWTKEDSHIPMSLTEVYFYRYQPALNSNIQLRSPLLTSFPLSLAAARMASHPCTRMADEYPANDLPKECLDQIITDFHIEVQNSRDVLTAKNPVLDAQRKGEKKNHVVVIVKFKQPYGQGRFQSARISMELNYGVPSPEDTIYGMMTVKLLRYDAMSPSAFSRYSFGLLYSDITLGTLLNVAWRRNMDQFMFHVTELGAYMGCRDWM